MTRLLALAALVLLAACQTTPTPRSTVDLVADVVKLEVPIILPTLNPSTQADVTRYAVQVEASRQAIDAGLTGPTVNAQTLVAALHGLAPLVAGNVPPNSPAAIAIASAVALAPLVLAEAGVVGARLRGDPAQAEKDRMVLEGVRGGAR